MDDDLPVGNPFAEPSPQLLTSTSSHLEASSPVFLDFPRKGLATSSKLSTSLSQDYSEASALLTPAGAPEHTASNGSHDRQPYHALELGEGPSTSGHALQGEPSQPQSFTLGSFSKQARKLRTWKGGHGLWQDGDDSSSLGARVPCGPACCAALACLVTLAAVAGLAVLSVAVAQLQATTRHQEHELAAARSRGWPAQLLGRDALAGPPAVSAAPPGAPAPEQDGSQYGWVYRLPHLFTVGDWDIANATADLTYTHMSMLTVLPNGSLAAAWQGSVLPGEGAPEQTIYWSVSTDGGATWQPPSRPLEPVFTDDGVRLPYWAPVLHTQGDSVWLFYAVSRDACRFQRLDKYGLTRWTPGGDVRLVRSNDSGATWGPPQDVFGFDAEGEVPKMVANKLAVTPGGGWVLPTWRENDQWDASWQCNKRLDLMGVPAALLSSDQGGTWTVSDSVVRADGTPGTWLIEAAVAPVARPGANATSLMQVFRTYRGVPLFQSWSGDGGRTWSPATPLPLPNPDSKVDMAALPSGALLLAYNDSPQLRTPLALALSRDGAAWACVVVLEDHPAAQFSYPTLQVVPASGQVLVMYTVLYFPDKWAEFLGTPAGAGLTAADLPPSGLRVFRTSAAALEGASAAQQPCAPGAAASGR